MNNLFKESRLFGLNSLPCNQSHIKILSFIPINKFHYFHVNFTYIWTFCELKEYKAKVLNPSLSRSAHVALGKFFCKTWVITQLKPQLKLVKCH